MNAGNPISTNVGAWYQQQLGPRRSAPTVGVADAGPFSWGPTPPAAPASATAGAQAITRDPLHPAVGVRADGVAVIDMARLVPASHGAAEVEQVRQYASDLARSATGRRLLLSLASLGGEIVMATPQQLTTAGLGTAAGKYHAATSSVLVDPRQPHQEAVQTLAHELQHLVDHKSGMGIGTQRSEARAFLAEARVAQELGWPVGGGAPFAVDPRTGGLYGEDQAMRVVGQSRWYSRLPAEAPLLGSRAAVSPAIAATPGASTAIASSAGQSGIPAGTTVGSLAARTPVGFVRSSAAEAAPWAPRDMAAAVRNAQLGR